MRAVSRKASAFSGVVVNDLAVARCSKKSSRMMKRGRGSGRMTNNDEGPDEILLSLVDR